MGDKPAIYWAFDDPKDVDRIFCQSINLQGFSKAVRFCIVLIKE